MPFRIDCPKCQAAYTCPDQQLGKKLQCAKCGQVFLAGQAAPQVQARPAAPAVVTSRRAPPPPPAVPQRSPAGLLIVVGLLATFLVGAAVGSIATYALMAPPERSVAQAPAPSQPQPPAEAKDGPLPPPQQKAPERDAPKEEPPQEESRGRDEPKPKEGPKPREAPKAAPKPNDEPKPKDEPKPPPPPAPQNDPPVKNGDELPRKAAIGREFVYQLTTDKGKATYNQVSGPKGLTISGDGLVRWTPEAGMDGVYEILVQVNGRDLQRYKIVVEDPAAAALKDPPVKNGDELPRKAVVGFDFAFQLTTDKGKAAYTQITGPKGLSVSRGGLVRWRPEAGQAGVHEFMVQLGNSGEVHKYKILVEEDPGRGIALLPLPAPGGWAMTPDNVTLIVSLPEQGKLVYFDTVAGKELNRVEVDFKPAALAIQGDTLFAAGKGTSMVYALDAKTGKAKKEYSLESDAVVQLACHPKQGLLYASTTKLGVYAIDPAGGEVTKTKARGTFLAVDPVDGKHVYTGWQPPLDEFGDVVVEEGADGKMKFYWDRWGKRAVIMKYAVAGPRLKFVAGQNNAAVNGWVLRLTPDGKRVMILGGGGWRPKGEGTGGGYVVALYNTDNLEAMVGQAPHGTDIIFHPVLSLGVTNHSGADLTVFNAKSLAKRGTVHIAKGGDQRQFLLTFGGKGTKVLVWNGEDVKNRQGLHFIPLALNADEQAALAKVYAN